MIPVQGWEECDGAGQPAVLVSSPWWSCPSCGWVGFRSNKPMSTPAHQRPIQTRLF